MAIVTREAIIEQLEAWDAHRLSAVMMHRWVVQLLSLGDCEYDDWVGEGRFSVAREALAELEMLDINMITRDDIPVFIIFLQSAPEEFEEAYIRFITALQAIDLPQRKQALMNKEPYARHCRSAV